MRFNYNGRLAPQELLLDSKGFVKRIRRAETNSDLLRTIVWHDRAIGLG
jgi:hypothetical protein